MSNLNNQMVNKYRNDFLKEVEANVEEGDWVKMCMQCGVCAGSCPMGPYWDHPPQEIFMMIRAGKREEVLSSTSMWMCTSCYNCIVRCPRELPITYIMHGLAHYATRLGIEPKGQPTRQFAQLFWDNLAKNGRVNELWLGVNLYFMNGFVCGVGYLQCVFGFLRRNKCFIILIAHIKFVLDCITYFVYSLGSGSPGVNMTMLLFYC